MILSFRLFVERMLKLDRFSPIAGSERIDAQNGVIFGCCVMNVGEAKGHGVSLDSNSLQTLLELTKGRPDGVGTRFGADHKAGAEDFNGALKNFRIVGDSLKADWHLLKSDLNFSKLIDMADKMPNEFGLSASTDAEKTDGGKAFKSPIRFTELFCVDVVTNPAATNGLFFSANNQTNIMKSIALEFGLPETATEAEILAFAKKCMSKDKEKKEMSEDDKEKADRKKDMSAEVEALKLDLSTKLESLNTKIAGFETAAKSAADSAKKAELETLKLEASRDGKVIPVGDETLLKLSIPEIKEMITKLPKGQLKLSRGITPTTADGKAITNRRSPEFQSFVNQKREEGALSLGQKMASQMSGLNLSN